MNAADVQPRETSLEAYYSLRDSGALSSLRWAVYETLFHHGPMTRNELDAHLRGENAINASYSRRLTELERMGLIRRAVVRPCRFSGRNCEAWDVTGASSPQPVDRPASKLELARDQIDELVELCEEASTWLDPLASARIRQRLAEIVGAR